MQNALWMTMARQSTFETWIFPFNFKIVVAVMVEVAG